MTMTVKGPNGLVVHFPDGTDHNTIDKVMRDAASKAPAPSLGAIAGDVATQGIAGLEKLGAGTLGLPGDIGRLHQTAETKLADLTKDSPVASTALKILDFPGRMISRGLSKLPGYEDIQNFAGPLPEAKTGYGQAAEIAGEWGPLVASPLRAGVKALTGRGARNVVRTDIEALRAAKNDAYATADTGIGKVTMTPQEYSTVQRAVNTVANEAGRGRVFEKSARKLHSESFGMADEINQIGNDIKLGKGPPPTYGDMEHGRQLLRKITNKAVTPKGDLNADGYMAQKLIDTIDTTLDASSGPYKMARAAHAKLRKAEDIEDAIFRAETQTSANYSQANFENAARQQFKNLANRLQKRNWIGWSKEEQAALMDVVHGRSLQNATRVLGKASPSGGLSKMLYMAFGFSHPILTGAAAAVTKGARGIAAQQGLKNVEKLQDVVHGTAAMPLTNQSRLATLRQRIPGLPHGSRPAILGTGAYRNSQ